MGVTKFVIEVLMRRRTSSNVIQKTDDEMTRFMKQTRIKERRANFEHLLNKDLQDKANYMNTAEIRQGFYNKLVAINNPKSLEQDKSRANDALSFSFLHEKTTFKPLGQWFRLMPSPSYAKDGEWSYTPYKTYFYRLVGTLALLKLGYELGKLDAETDPLKENLQNVVWMESEDQIFDYLLNQQKTAVFLLFYSPGHKITEKWNAEFERASGLYKSGVLDPSDPSDEVVFMRVHCRKHLNFCINKMWQGRQMPAAELYYLNEQDQIELADFGHWHRSRQGIQGFFEKTGIIEDKMDPESLLDRAGRKFLSKQQIKLTDNLGY